MRKKLCLLFLISCVFIVIGCSPKLESIAIQGNSEIPVDGSTTLTVIGNPKDAIIDKIEWISSDITVAKVDNGTVVGISEGTATITAKVNDIIRTAKNVDVYQPTESITIDKTELKLKLDEEQTLNVLVKPENSSYELESNNTFVVKVYQDGIVKAINYGNTTIIARTKDKKEAICNVTVAVTVPNFSIMSLDEIKKWGNSNKIKVEFDDEYSDSIKKNKIISQSISAGTEISESGKTIKIVYSLGHKPTLGESNALDKAEEYLRYMSFSAKGLKKQLLYEGFSNSEAQYGVDNCDADWNEQAAKKAEEYLRYMSFSRSGLKRQLLYEGFTSKQVEYGLKAVGY